MCKSRARRSAAGVILDNSGDNQERLTAGVLAVRFAQRLVDAPATDGEHLRSAPSVRFMLHGFPGRSRHDQSLKYRNLVTQ
jgi:hypothetical protein